MSEIETRSPTPLLPTYTIVRHFLRLLDGIPYSRYRITLNTIQEQRGSRQAGVNWADPDEWISERLEGEAKQFAEYLWNKSKHQINPRYLRGPWYFTKTKHNLIDLDDKDILYITERGEQFLHAPEGPLVANIDGYEGILTVLRIITERGPGKRSDFLPEYEDYCQSFTTYRSERVIKDSWHARSVNLLERNYVTRSWQTYEITDAGLAYLEKWNHLLPRHADSPSSPEIASKLTQLRQLSREISQTARAQLFEHISTMNPYKFEELVKYLLEEMGYINVEVTSPSNDKGVDVVADIELGITSVREVIQAKRQKGNVGRPVLDQLRGTLHRFNAVRGTIITTGGFSKGTRDAAFERGAAPITLIDGQKLLDLLVENKIGVTIQPVEYMAFDPGKLPQPELEEDIDPEE